MRRWRTSASSPWGTALGPYAERDEAAPQLAGVAVGSSNVSRAPPAPPSSNMSREQAYFPPSGTKYTWTSKALNYSPWTCRPWYYWGASVSASVDLVDGKYKWRVEAVNWRHKRRIRKGSSASAKRALLRAEAVCDEEKDKLWRPWMLEAKVMGWHP